MTALETIRAALDFADRATTSLLEDMRDAPFTQPTPRGGNHPLWVLGHVTFVEAALPAILFGETNTLGHWAPLFAPGSEPTIDAAAYPPFDELLATYRRLRARNLEALDDTGEQGLDRVPKAAPRGLESEFRTFGQTFLFVAMHQICHMGQVADARRAAGRKPLFTPGQ
jgi:DinB family protein